TVEALYLRYRILQNFEMALMAPPEELEGLMNFIIVGGGPTGVELAGAIAEMKKNVLPKDYADLNFKIMQIHLLEGSPKLLANMSEPASRKSKIYLERLGVKVLLNTRVKDYDGKFVSLEDGTTIPAKTVIWAAGIQGNPVQGLKAEALMRGNRFIVDRQNKIE